MIGPDRCALCAHPDKRDLGTSLAHWRDAPKGMAYEHVVRCTDVRACRARPGTGRHLAARRVCERSAFGVTPYHRQREARREG
jgi:hypothetical protein